MVRFYLIPVETNLVGATPWRGPKYFRWRHDPDPPGIRVLMRTNRYYGGEPSMLVAADVSNADDATLITMPDVTKFADNLDQELGADLGAIQTAIEALNLPGHMLTAATTHRQVIRGVMGILDIANCMDGKGFNIFGAGVTLETLMSAVPVVARESLIDCAATLGYDRTGITLGSSVRQVLGAIVSQAAPSPMCGVTV